MFSLSDQTLDIDALRKSVTDDTCGAYASFEGWVRNHNEGESVDRLQYEAFAELANTEGNKIIAEAKDRFDLVAIVCVHRVGDLAIGDCAVWVGAASHHRAAAFEGCRYVIDEVKARVPIWKNEHYTDGRSGWVNAETG